jgi:hypothetical protein
MIPAPVTTPGLLLWLVKAHNCQTGLNMSNEQQHGTKMVAQTQEKTLEGDRRIKKMFCYYNILIVLL